MSEDSKVNQGSSARAVCHETILLGRLFHCFIDDLHIVVPRNKLSCATDTEIRKMEIVEISFHAYIDAERKVVKYRMRPEHAIEKLIEYITSDEIFMVVEMNSYHDSNFVCKTNREYKIHTYVSDVFDIEIVCNIYNKGGKKQTLTIKNCCIYDPQRFWENIENHMAIDEAIRECCTDHDFDNTMDIVEKRLIALSDLASVILEEYGSD